MSDTLLLRKTTLTLRKMSAWPLVSYCFNRSALVGVLTLVPVRRCLLQGAELSLATGRRYGLIGRNGLGKTTLLKMLASRSLRVPSHISILHVEQEVAGDDTVALQSVLESDTVREALLKEERSLNAHIANGTYVNYSHQCLTHFNMLLDVCIQGLT